MGLNMVAVCHSHKQRLYVFRGYEHAALRHWFFSEHRDCKEQDPRAVEISHDQARDAWLEDPSYAEDAFPEDFGL